MTGAVSGRKGPRLAAEAPGSYLETVIGRGPASSKTGAPVGTINRFRGYARCSMPFNFRQNSLAYRAAKAQNSRRTLNT